MKLEFDKIEGCGNDFVLISQAPDPAWIEPICDRHHGIGADGISYWHYSETGIINVDHFDPDGSQSFCLNGLRSTLHCLYLKKEIPKEGMVRSEGQDLTYQIGDQVQIRLPKRPYEARTWQGEMGDLNGFYVDVGNPHFVVLDQVQACAMPKLAPQIRHDILSNVHFVKTQADIYDIVSYERGVEGFTLACGSGMLSAALVIMGEYQRLQVDFNPQGRGQVRIVSEGEELLFSGDANWVASGVWFC